MSDETLFMMAADHCARVGLARGDYLWHERRTHRIVGVDRYTASTRPVHRPHIVEWLRAKFEDYVQWPLRDWRAK